MVPFKAPAAVLDELGITEPSEIVIEAIAQHCGATIVYEPLDGCEARIIGRGDRAIITVSSKAPRPRQRFSGMHELGHWMRDRGRIAFACTANALLREWGDDNPERRANRWGADVLLPRRMFQTAAGGLPPTFDSARALAKAFETSLTATAIRLVELGAMPAMVVCTEATGRRWFFRADVIPRRLWPVAHPGSSTVAARLLSGELRQSAGPETVDASEWINDPRAAEYALVEDSVLATGGMVLTLLWWKDESQLLDVNEDGEEDAEPALTGHLTFGSGKRRR